MATPDSYGETDNSDSLGNGSISTSGNRMNVRLVTLHKANVMLGSTLGFSIRGGREHAIGIFITHVEPRSEAERAGLQVGDQIMRINGFPIEDATHAEVLQLIQANNTITLKVRSVGMIPTKERDKGVTWKIVEPKNNIGNGQSQGEKSFAHITMEVPSHGRLGCGICKGPVWKPGIFVQFTKDNCIAKESGLQRGDQILECNGVKFTSDLSFEDAVKVMKSAGFLDLIIHKGAGMDLFPGGSSGYSSSTSSVNGDHNPQDEPTLVQFKRLSVVKEESVGNGRTNSLEEVNRVEPAPPKPNSQNQKSLSSAIHEELKRRSERTVNGVKNHVPAETKKVPDDNYHQKLQTLMKEVKAAHNKMFPGGVEEEVSEKPMASESPPLCPTPDYDTMSLISNKTSRDSHEFVEMSSFKSFSQNKAMPKPPPVYFPPPGFQDEKDSSLSSVQNSSRPVPQSTIVTVRQYPTNNEKPVPSKMKFLNNKPNCVRFGDELTQTLSQVSITPKEQPPHPQSPKKNSNVVTISIQHPPPQSSFFLHSTKKGPAPMPPTKNKVTFNF